MTNLIESIELVKALAEHEFAIGNSISFLHKDKSNKKAYSEAVDMIHHIDRLLVRLAEDCEVQLSNADYSVNFFALCDAIKSGDILKAYRSCKVIRAEMLIETTPDNLEEFKTLSEFWESLELSFGMLLK
jgi:hypothetical protein